jgi:hypothetical protein
MFTTGLNQGMMLASIQNKLTTLRSALNDVADLQGWAAGVSATDLETNLSINAADAAAILSAISDAAALSSIYQTGQAPATYPQVTGEPYDYAASQR